MRYKNLLNSRKFFVIQFIIIVAGILSNSFSPADLADINEKIRRKVENLSLHNDIGREFEIYCVLSITEVYNKNGFERIWTEVNQINEFIRIIETCNADGLNPMDYHLEDIHKFINRKSSEDIADLDILLTDAFLLYTSHIISGKTNPQTIDAEWHVIKTERNPVKYIYEIEQKSVNDIFSELYPKNTKYNQLKEYLVKYKHITENGGWENVKKGEMLRPGITDNRISLIRKRLTITGDLENDTVSDPDFYDDNLKESVIAFQQRHRLEALGNIGNQTIEALNIPAEEKIKTIEINLERWRWLPVEFSNYYLLVNIANFELDVIEDRKLISNHKVIVGKPYRKTPVFNATMQYIVFNPTWTVPPTILKNDLLPEVRKNIDYLALKNIAVFNNKGSRLSPDSINWRSNEVYSYTYRQEPGKANALGVVKFMFPNNYNVYLHDTPNKELFEKSERAFSSGCIRVQKPLELAELLISSSVKWNKTNIQKVIETNKTQTIILKEKPEVYLLYWTSWVDDNGAIHFRKDIYERDKVLYKALNDKPVYDLN